MQPRRVILLALAITRSLEVVRLCKDEGLVLLQSNLGKPLVGVVHLRSAGCSHFIKATWLSLDRPHRKTSLKGDWRSEFPPVIWYVAQPTPMQRALAAMEWDPTRALSTSLAVKTKLLCRTAPPWWQLWLWQGIFTAAFCGRASVWWSWTSISGGSNTSHCPGEAWYTPQGTSLQQRTSMQKTDPRCRR